jgi:hypothetical protein
MVFFPRLKGSSQISPHTLPLTVGSVAVLPEDHRVLRGSRRQRHEGVAAWDSMENNQGLTCKQWENMLMISETCVEHMRKSWDMMMYHGDI